MRFKRDKLDGLKGIWICTEQGEQDKMTEITELEEKYLVLKWRDIQVELSEKQRHTLDDIIQTIYFERREHGIKENKYLVLNLNDEIDLDSFGDCFFGDEFDENQKTKVKDIAVALVNAILRAKGE